MIDYHLHGNFCGHGSGELEEYVTVAIAKHFLEIGFSAHLPKVKDPDPYHAMLEEDLPRYVDLVRELGAKYEDRITIRLGIEADYFPGYEREIDRLIRSQPFDYVLGAVHYLDDWHFTSKAGRERYRTEDPDTSYAAYFELLGRMIRSGLFDIVAHPDAIRKEWFRPKRSMECVHREIASLLGASSMSIEVNTAGIRRHAGSVYPDPLFLGACIEEGVSLTLGSDAHVPGDVGRDYGEAFELLLRLGVAEVATYEGRRKTARPLSRFIPADG
jgi:histidinol-phosphatase (PHP family)